MNQGNERTTSMSKTKGLVQMAIFAALIVVLAFTPFIGYIPLGFTRATIIHIPVIMGSLMLGPKKGAALGGVFGLTSFINNTINPTLTSFVFTPFYSLGEYSGGIGSLIICFVPRILIGVVPFYVYRLVKKLSKNNGVSSVGLIVAGLSGALTNTLLVMNLIFVFFRNDYAAAGIWIYSEHYRNQWDSGGDRSGGDHAGTWENTDEKRGTRKIRSVKNDTCD